MDITLKQSYAKSIVWRNVLCPVMVSQKKRHRRGLGKQEFIILTGPRKRRQSYLSEGHIGIPQGGQEAESSSMGKAEARARLEFPWEWQGCVDSLEFGWLINFHRL